tara:strand:+ start:399 stop:695 length:297 start_codon:yes stop_codon:yes gene_type:complete
MVVKLLNLSRFKWLRYSLIGLSLLIAALVIYFPNYAKLKKLRDENLKISNENKKLAKEIKDFEEKLQKLGRDPFVYEKIAREDLGVAKENEIVIDIEQ